MAARALLIRSDINPYHITARTNNKEFFPLPLNEVWEICLNRLKHIHSTKSLAIHAFILMGNHFHLLCHTPKSNIDECMHEFMRSISFEINKRLNQHSHLWGSRYKCSLISSQKHYYQVYRYIYQNPIRAKIVFKVEEYPYSTLQKELPFPIHSHMTMSFGGQSGELYWLNQIYQEEELKLIRLGLRRFEFDVRKRESKNFDKLSKPE